MRIQHDNYSLQAAADLPLVRGWTSADPDVERARALLDQWDAVLTLESTAGAIYRRWAGALTAPARSTATPAAERQRLAETALRSALDRLTNDWGSDWSQWRYGRVNQSPLPHMFVAAFDLTAVERGGGDGTVNAPGANFRRIVDLSDLDRSVGSNSPGQSAQPESPYYGNLRERLGNGEYFPLLFTRQAVDAQVAHRLTLRPGR
jgi:penicillin amidase